MIARNLTSLSPWHAEMMIGMLFVCWGTSMLWRDLFSNRRVARQQRTHSPRPVEITQPVPLGYALEPGMLFDGAVAATVDQTAAAQETTPTPTADTATHADDSHAQSSESQTRGRQSGHHNR
ncbi:hypothetical protein CWS02_19960 [Enterobacter sp. EA-1]|nr:hypothetical protein CWS02_19960 [Enterobacter sp. EA-1]